MTIRAKFICQGINRIQTGIAIVTLMPAPDAEEDRPNADWSQYAPQGKVEVTITEPDALAQFQHGKAYAIEITAED